MKILFMQRERDQKFDFSLPLIYLVIDKMNDWRVILLTKIKKKKNEKIK